MLEFGYLDNREQGDIFTRTNRVENDRVILQKYWMDTKRKNTREQIAQSLADIINQLEIYKPHLLLLGDDNAANYIGNQYLDTGIPVVFWGVNGVPLKYGLLESLEHPGHNVTGIYQAGYHLESIKYLQLLVPGLKRIALLSDDSPTGRSLAKKVTRYSNEGMLPVTVVKVVVTNSFTTWKQEALALQDQVDAFFISTHNTLVDDNGEHVDYLTVARWHLKTIQKPEVVPSSHMVSEGFLATVDDTGFSQGYEAIKIMHAILAEGKMPAEISSYAPGRGPFIVNSWRAKMLGLTSRLEQHAESIDKIVESHDAWNH